MKNWITHEAERLALLWGRFALWLGDRLRTHAALLTLLVVRRRRDRNLAAGMSPFHREPLVRLPEPAKEPHVWVQCDPGKARPARKRRARK